MQFYLNGFRPGDPAIRPADPDAHPAELPDEVDVLIVGTGPAGLVLAAQMAEFPDITTRIVERREGPLDVGRADGVACRTVEMFDAFGLAESLTREGYWINETTFWGPLADQPDRIARTGRVQDVADGLSEYPHVIVNQARMQALLLERMAHSPSRLAPDYGFEVSDVAIAGDGSHPVTVTLRRSGDPTGATEDRQRLVKAKYVIGCDGARSQVRRALGIDMVGDARNHAWGVLDVFAVTDFPDIRMKAVIQSADGGSLLIIPREGGYMVRLYVDLGDLDPHDRDARSRFTATTIVETAQRILHPYFLDVKDIAWWSVYEVGQRLASRFTDADPADETSIPRVFIAGDACHTHSAKAGQGMNVSMQDGFNLGWKLAAVLRGRSPQGLLKTYEQERRGVAQELIDFDVKWSEAMAAKPADPNDPGSSGMSATERQEIFSAGGRFTAGFSTDYQPSIITGRCIHEHLAKGFPVGERFHSSPVIRLADAKPVELGHQATADGRWRLYIFADTAHPRSPQSKASALCRYLESSADSPISLYTPTRADLDTVFDVRAVFQMGHRDLAIDDVPEFLFPHKGRFGLIDYEKVFCADVAGGSDIFDQRAVDREQGALVIVRPDQYVAHVLPLDAYEELARFFAQNMIEHPGQ
ncbi:phenol 2-monooxygenase [Brevibacterium sanguinis]|uniref:Phenol 2-monooxygenase n=2 Tax=Brevibacterium TaxID=1696 RepID=A0A366IPK3_9MICO|nr:MULTISPECIES: FAD-dependent monooxygenase [Brevibacterium]RBP67814.1 phenol 2-monooxygenase [Brevibacterium sanguinis]RBP74769.1 phenol 2-monooxygenase [Brevibacterium celere]